MRAFCVLIFILFYSCHQRPRNQIPHRIKCFSGVLKIYDGTTMGFVDKTDLGYSFIDTFGYRVEISAKCITRRITREKR